MNLNDIKNSVKWNVILLPAIAVVSLLTNIFLVRTLSLEAYALYMILISFKNTFLGMSDFGISTSYTRFFHQIEHENGRSGIIRFTYQTLLIKISLAALLLIVIVLFNDLFVRYFKIETVPSEALLIVAVLIILEGVSNVFERFYEVNLRQRILNFIKFFHAISFVAMLYFLFVLQGLNVESILYALFAATVLKVSSIIWIFIKDTHRSGITKGDDWLNRNKVRFFKSSATIYFDKASATVLAVSFLILIMAPYFDKKDIAYLALAGDFVSKAVSLFLLPTNGLILPIFSHYYAYRKDSGLSQIHEYSIKYFIFIFIVAAGLLVVNAKDIVIILYSKTYLPSVSYINLFLPIIFLEQAVLSTTTSIFFVKETYSAYWKQRFMVVLAIAVLVAIVTTIKIGIMLAVVLLCMVKFLNIAIQTYANYKVNTVRFPLKVFTKIFLIASIGGMLSGFISNGVTHGAIVRTISASIAYAFFIIAGMRLFSPFNSEDKDMLLEIPLVRRLKWILG